MERHEGLRRLRLWGAAHRGDLLGITVIVGLILAFLSPALVNGGSFGGFDFDTTLSSLGNGLYSSVHSVKNGDAVSQMISWNALDWRIVHNGEFPLWNTYSVLGMPEFFNFESGVLSLPDLVSYAVPIQFAFLVVVAMKLLIAATGVYVVSRVLGVRAPGATFGAVTFMFAGAFVNWVTWPLTDVVAWTGWICAFALLAYRTRGPRYVVLLAAAVAFSVFGGFPEANVMVVMAFAVLVVVSGTAMVATRRRFSADGMFRVVLGSLGGVGLAAPLWLPGMQVISLSHRQYDGGYAGLPMKTLSLIFTQGYYGLASGPNSLFQLPRWNYYETVAYVGAFAVILVLIGLISSYRRPLVFGLGAALAFSLAATYEPQPLHLFQSAVNHLSWISTVRFERMRTVSAFFIAVLAAIGCDRLLARLFDRPMRRAFAVSTGLVAAVICYLVVDSLRAQLPPPFSNERVSALIWPVALVLLAVALVGFIGSSRITAKIGRERAKAAVFSALFAGQAGFLFFAGVGVPTYSKQFYGTTASEQTFAKIVGTKLVGLDGGNTTNVRLYSHVGFYPNVNIGYGIHLFAVHDPLTPSAYYTSWPITGAAPVKKGVGLFVPDINTADLARRYGISFIIASSHLPAPDGTTKAATFPSDNPRIPPETLYRVPGAAQFSFATSTPGTRVTSSATNENGSFTITMQAARLSTLVLRVTALPGWHATCDGAPLRISSYDGVMQSVVVPRGHHTIKLTYLPRRFSLGLIAALVVAAMLVAWCLVAALRSRSEGHAPVPFRP